MSFWKSLFGNTTKSGDAQTQTPSQVVEYKGYRIEAVPYAEAGQFQVAGIIRKDIAGVSRQHRFVRADRFASRDEAADTAISKGRIIIDQQGDRLFDT